MYCFLGFSEDCRVLHAVPVDCIPFQMLRSAVSRTDKTALLFLAVLRTVSGLQTAAYPRGPQEWTFPHCPIPDLALHSPPWTSTGQYGNLSIEQKP